jgi:hypothetical protein
MTIPLLHFTNLCWGILADKAKSNQLCTKSTIAFCSALFIDAAVWITALVVGILGALAVINMPAAAYFTLFGVSGTITLLWIALLVKRFYFDKRTTHSQIR